MVQNQESWSNRTHVWRKFCYPILIIRVTGPSQLAVDSQHGGGSYTHVTPPIPRGSYILIFFSAACAPSVRFPFHCSLLPLPLSLFCALDLDRAARRHGGELSPRNCVASGRVCGSGEVVPDNDEGWPASPVSRGR